jgi:cytochrome P450
VGNHFALMEGQLVLTRLAQRFKLEGSIERMVEAEPLVTLRPKQAVRMRITPRFEPAPALRTG